MFTILGFKRNYCYLRWSKRISVSSKHFCVWSDFVKMKQGWFWRQEWANKLACICSNFGSIWRNCIRIQSTKMQYLMQTNLNSFQASDYPSTSPSCPTMSRSSSRLRMPLWCKPGSCCPTSKSGDAEIHFNPPQPDQTFPKFTRPNFSRFLSLIMGVSSQN